MQDVSLREIVLKLGIMLLVALAMLGGCSALNRAVGLKDDHIAEELAEAAIERQLGLEKGSLDLTPGSQE